MKNMHCCLMCLFGILFLTVFNAINQCTLTMTAREWSVKLDHKQFEPLQKGLS